MLAATGVTRATTHSAAIDKSAAVLVILHRLHRSSESGNYVKARTPIEHGTCQRGRRCWRTGISENDRPATGLGHALSVNDGSSDADLDAGSVRGVTDL